MPPCLENFPNEILDEIAISLVISPFLGPPADLLPLLRVSTAIWRKLRRNYNSHLYSRIFLLKFDARAIVRRLGDDCQYATELSDELVQRWKCLKRIRSGFHLRNGTLKNRRSRNLREDLWKAYLMFIESDGKNAKQLIHYARVDIFALNFVTPGGAFHNGTTDNGGWVVDNERNALIAWLFWFTDRDRVSSETPTERQSILQAFFHVIIGSFKYSATHAPITSFQIPPTESPLPPAPSRVFPLAASPVSARSFVPDHFGFKVPLACPLLTPAILLSCVARLEAVSAEMTLPHSLPATRADAMARGQAGPTREDYEELRQATPKLVEWDGDGKAGSEKYEHDWLRSLTCYDPWRDQSLKGKVFTPGMLDGLWLGRCFIIPIDQFAANFSADGVYATPHVPLIYPDPMQFRLREHHQHVQKNVVGFDDISCDGTGKGVFNAWLPQGTVLVQSQGELLVRVSNTTTPSIYRTYSSAAAAKATLDNDPANDLEYEGLYGQGVWDVLLTGETEGLFENAWGHRKYYGRVRSWDGLVVLVRKAMHPAECPWIFRGYVHGKQNLVGRWRETWTPVDLPGWEGVWSMTKQERS